MSHDAPQHGSASQGYDWSDPHHFHHGPDALDHSDHHHASPWQLLVGILGILLALTALTVFSAEAERWLIGLGVHISHFWNVVIALSIALVKAVLVCMYFMHLKNDSPLNTMILLTTIFVFGLFLLFTGIDLYERDAVNPFKAQYVQAGGTGVGMAPGGGSFRTGIADARKQQRIDKYAAEFAKANGHLNDQGAPAPTDQDVHAAEAKFWADFYHHKIEDHPEHLPERHAYDTNDHHADWVAHHLAEHGAHHVSDASTSVPRHGRTPGLFSTDAHDEHGGDGHADPHGDHTSPADQPAEHGSH